MHNVIPRYQAYVLFDLWLMGSLAPRLRAQLAANKCFVCSSSALVKPRTCVLSDCEATCGYTTLKIRLPTKEANEWRIECSSKLWEARSRLYRHRFLQVNTKYSLESSWRDLQDLILLHCWDINISAQMRPTFRDFSRKQKFPASCANLFLLLSQFYV